VLAVIVLMLTTLVCALLANFRAELTERNGRITLLCNKLSGQAANRRALHIKPNAAPHHFNIFFTQTGCRAIITGSCAGITGFQTLFIFSFHISSLSSCSH